MKRFLLIRLKYLVLTVLVLIPASAVVTFLYWFFVDVIAGKPVQYIDSWSWCYLVLFVWAQGYDTIASFILGGLFTRKLARKWGVSFSDVIDALADFELSKQSGYRDWNAEEFKQWFMIRKSIHGMVSKVMDSIT